VQNRRRIGRQTVPSQKARLRGQADPVGDPAARSALS
jgi:hypothetical protein